MTTVFSRLERRTGGLLIAVALATAALTIPLLGMDPDESASTEPGGAVFDAFGGYTLAFLFGLAFNLANLAIIGGLYAMYRGGSRAEAQATGG